MQQSASFADHVSIWKKIVHCINKVNFKFHDYIFLQVQLVNLEQLNL